VVDRFIARIPDENRRRRARNTYLEMPLPARRPLVAAVLVGALGDVWVGQYVSGFDFSPFCWWIFAQAGELLESRCLPERFTPYQIGADFILGVSKDEVDTERVVVYRLSR
jgi:hypothetical protein